MIIDAFNPSHLEQIKKWVAIYQMGPELIQDLPATGFIVHKSNVFYAAGFLRRIENCPDAFIDSLIANPETSGKMRYRALDLVVEKLIQTAKKLKLRQLIGYTVDSAVMKRSFRHGFFHSSASVILRSI